MKWSVSNIEMILGGTPDPDSWLIYKIDSEVAAGATIPNLGEYTLGGDDMTVTDLSPPFGQLRATSALGPGSLSGPSDNYFTVLLRAGNVATVINASQGTLDDRVDVLGSGYAWGLYAFAGRSPGGPYQEYRSVGLLDGGPDNTTDPESNTILMATIDVGGGSGDFRAVVVSGGVVSNWTTLSPLLFTPGNILPPGRLRLEKAFGYISGVPHGLWSESYNGVAIWREQCFTDADFLRLHNQFVAA